MIPAIRPQQLPEWLASCAAAGEAGLPIVLDVREPWEVQLASVRPNGFELRAIPMANVPHHIDDLPRDRPIACMCHHGVRSAQVARFLVSQGFEAVVNITGGIHAWSDELDTSVPRY